MVSIRPANVADVPVLESIARAAYLPWVPRIGRPPAPAFADYRAAVRAGEAWLACEASEAIGLIVLIPNPDHLLLENVAVLPAAQGRGIGTLLLAFADERSRALGLREIRLYTNAAMTENIAYYARHGYTETHRAEEHGFHRVFFSRRPDG
jgi:ribosomal protein S18 acetylase RimI-like enzyme